MCYTVLQFVTLCHNVSHMSYDNSLSVFNNFYTGCLCSIDAKISKIIEAFISFEFEIAPFDKYGIVHFDQLPLNVSNTTDHIWYCDFCDPT